MARLLTRLTGVRPRLLKGHSRSISEDPKVKSININIDQTLTVNFEKKKKKKKKKTAASNTLFQSRERSDNSTSHLWRSILLNKNVQTTALRTWISNFTSRREIRVVKRLTIYPWFVVIQKHPAPSLHPGILILSYLNLIIRLIFRVGRNGQFGKNILFNVHRV